MDNCGRLSCRVLDRRPLDNELLKTHGHERPGIFSEDAGDRRPDGVNQN